MVRDAKYILAKLTGREKAMRARRKSTRKAALKPNLETRKVQTTETLTWHKEDGCTVARGNMTLYKVEKTDDGWHVEQINQYARVITDTPCKSLVDGKSVAEALEQG